MLLYTPSNFLVCVTYIAIGCIVHDDDVEAGSRFDTEFTEPLIASSSAVSLWLPKALDNVFFVVFSPSIDGVFTRDLHLCRRLLKYIRITSLFETFMFETKPQRHTRECRVLHIGKTTYKFDVAICVKQGCIMSLMFVMTIDWTIRTHTEGNKMVYSGHYGTN